MGKHGIEFVKCCVNIKSIFQGLSVAFWFIIHNVYTPTAYKTNNRLWYIAEKHEIHSFIFCYINNNFFNPARVKYNPNKIIFKCT